MGEKVRVQYMTRQEIAKALLEVVSGKYDGIDNLSATVQKGQELLRWQIL